MLTQVDPNPDRSAVEIAWEAVLTSSKRAKKLGNLIALSSSESYVSKFHMGLLHRCVLGLTRLELKDLLESIPVHTIDEKDDGGQTPLYWAARRGDLHAVSLLLDAGADQNSKNNRGSSILTAAIMSGNAECIWKILHSGCDIHLPQKGGYTPLHYCCRYDADLDLTKHILLANSATSSSDSSSLINLNAQTSLGHTPLMLATFNTRPHLTNLLINYNADLDIQAKDGATALHYAVMAGDCESVRYLLAQGANYLLRRIGNSGEEGLLDVLKRRRGDCEMVRMFLEFELKGLELDVEASTGKERVAERSINGHNDNNTDTTTNNNDDDGGGHENEKKKDDCNDDEWSKLFNELIEKIRAEREWG